MLRKLKRLLSNGSDPKFLGSWVQNITGSHLVFDVASADYAQHIDAQPGEVLLIPYQVAVILVQASTPLFSPLTMAPAGFGITNDPVTGLDQAYVVDTACYGVDGNGQPYFDPDAGAAPGEAQRLFYINGTAYLSND